MSTIPPQISLPIRLGSHNEVIRQALRQFSYDLRVATPGFAKDFDATRQVCSVEVAIRENVINPKTRKLDKFDIDLLTDVPIVLPRAGGFGLTMPIPDGTECLVLFADRCIDDWWQSGTIGNQLAWRTHDLSDGFAIVGIWSQPNKLINYSQGTAQLRTDNGLVYVEVTSDSINLVGGVTPGRGGIPSVVNLTPAGAVIKNAGSVMTLNPTGAVLDSAAGHVLDMSGASAILKAAGGASALSLTGAIASITGGLSIPSLPGVSSLATDATGKVVAGLGGNPVPGGFVPGGDLSGGTTFQVVIGLQSKPLDPTVGSPADKQIIQYDASAGKWRAQTLAPAVTFAGDLGGSSTLQVVIGLHGKLLDGVTMGAPLDQQFVQYDAVSGMWKAKTQAGQVNSDWNATSGVAAILNKPAIYTPQEYEVAIITPGTVVTLPTLPRPGTPVLVFRGGLKLSTVANDYTISGSTITFMRANLPGDVVDVVFFT